jgi:hypothetical protein|tara:strand:+ start:53 stop:454 length:402 start_codon:yes stop_codon:yes gene_type:complete
MKALELTKELTDQICQELMNGQPLTRICSRKELPSIATVNRWISKDPSFAKQITNARRVGTQFYLDKMIEELETMSAKDVGIVREKLHHYRWLASKLLPSLYGDKQEVVQDTKITIQWQQDPKIVEGQVVSAD